MKNNTDHRFDYLSSCNKFRQSTLEYKSEDATSFSKNHSNLKISFKNFHVKRTLNQKKGSNNISNRKQNPYFNFFIYVSIKTKNT